jgi:hypothetical protein
VKRLLAFATLIAMGSSPALAEPKPITMFVVDTETGRARWVAPKDRGPNEVVAGEDLREIQWMAHAKAQWARENERYWEKQAQWQQQRADDHIAAFTLRMFKDRTTEKLVDHLLRAGWERLDADERERFDEFTRVDVDPQHATRLFALLGPGFVKLGQALAGRGDEVLTTEYRATLKRHGDHVEADRNSLISNLDTMTQALEEVRSPGLLPRPLQRHFADLDEASTRTFASMLTELKQHPEKHVRGGDEEMKPIALGPNARPSARVSKAPASIPGTPAAQTNPDKTKVRFTFYRK